MQKVYLLLRNNQQTGPFSLEEIIQFDLKPYDLIWIEGKSAGWYYPQELKELHPHLSFIKHSPQSDTGITFQTQTASSSEEVKPKKIFVAMPASPTQEEVIQKPSAPFVSAKSESFKPAESSRQAEPELKTTYAKSLEEVETEYMNWAYQKKKKKGSAVSKKGAIAACLLVGVAFAAWWAVKSSSGADNGATGQFALTPIQAELPVDTAAETNTVETDTKAAAKKEIQSKIATTKEAATTLLKKDAIRKINNEVVSNDNAAVNNEYETTTSDKEDAAVPVNETKAEPIVEATKEKKKKLGEKFLDLFKKKPEEQKSEEVNPAENENGERRSVRRETNLATQVTIKFEVPNDWMMGIKGSKAFLTNRSAETIVKATIEVHYYNEDNELLQTKTVSFSNIGAKKTAIVSIPDHSFADHLDYKIISVQGAAEPFAKM